MIVLAIGSTEYPICVTTGGGAPYVQTAFDDAPLLYPFDPKPRIGRFVFPVVGASRPAHAQFVVPTATLTALRTAPGAIKLRVSNGPATSYTEFVMRLLAVHPLSKQISVGSGETQGWVVTLVDSRWYWQFMLADASPSTSSWTGWFTDQLGHVGVSAPVLDVPDGAIGTPGGRWLSQGVLLPAAYALDEAAICTGTRLVFTENNTYLQRPFTAYYTSLASWLPAAYAAGGSLGLDSTASLPGTFAYTYATGRDTVALAGGISGLTLDAWLALTRAYEEDATLRVAALTAWRDETAAWASSVARIVYPGWPGMPPVSGFLDSIEVVYTDEEFYTVLRPTYTPYTPVLPRVYAYVGDNPPNDECDGCGWVAGLRQDQCLTATLTAASGSCSGLTTGQVLDLVYVDPDGHWSSGTDLIDIGASSYIVRFTRNCTGPCLGFYVSGSGGETLVYELTLDCCGPGYAIFKGGGETNCTGTPEPCGGNTFTIRVECGECPSTCCLDASSPTSLWFVYDGGYVELTRAASPDCWTGSFTPSGCTDTVYLRLCEDCVLEYTCDTGLGYTSVPCEGLCESDCTDGVAIGPYSLDLSAGLGCTDCEGILIGDIVDSEPTSLGCCPAFLVGKTIYASLSGGEGTITMTFNGTDWAGNKVLSCGKTLYLKFNAALCTLGYSCNDSLYFPAACATLECTEPYTLPTCTITLPGLGIGCEGCSGVYTVVLSQ